MIAPGGRVKVLDFGLARHLPPEPAAETRAVTTEFATRHGTAGTVGYMAPEQIEGRPADARSDVFALGVVMFELLTGQRPFGGDTAWATMNATVNKPAPDVSRLRSDTPPALVRIVTRALAREPADRYQSAGELAQDLRALRAPASSSAAIDIAPPDRDRRGNRGRDRRGHGRPVDVEALVGRRVGAPGRDPGNRSRRGQRRLRWRVSTWAPGAHRYPGRSAAPAALGQRHDGRVADERAVGRRRGGEGLSLEQRLDPARGDADRIGQGAVRLAPLARHQARLRDTRGVGRRQRAFHILARTRRGCRPSDGVRAARRGGSRRRTDGARRLLDRQVRSHQPSVQAVRGRRRLSHARLLARAVRRRTAARSSGTRR